MTQVSWPVVTLGDHIDLLTGFPFKSARFSNEHGDVRLIRGANVQQGFIDWAPLKRWPASDEASYASYRLAVGDVVLAMDRPWVDAGLKWATVGERDTPSFLVQRVSRLRGTTGLLTDFLPYVVGSEAFADYIAPIVTGVNVPHISPTQIKGFHFRLPPLSTQRRIASILSAYDDLIENNTRRIQILEEMAQAIYREWFVEFRFPGHEDVRMVDSELGSIPEGWRASRLGELSTNLDRFRRPLSSLRRADMPGPFPYYGAAKIFDFVNDYIFDGTYLLLAEDGSVMTSEGLPVLQYVTGKFWANNHTHILQGHGVSIEYLYLALSGIQISGYVTGAAQPKVTHANLNRMPMIAPSQSYMIAFDRVVKSMFELVETLKRSIANMRQARDLLLPRLISGEIDVSNLDIGNAEPAA
jgi:type I restriction enzyme, S subunit